jgi:hypothetical protein
MKREPIFDVSLREARLERNQYLRGKQLNHLGTRLLRTDSRKRKAQAPKPKAPEPDPPSPNRKWCKLAELKSTLK